MNKKSFDEQILINVSDDGTIEVYWHDPEGSGATQPKISVVYESDRSCENESVQNYINDFDEVVESDWTYQIE